MPGHAAFTTTLWSVVLEAGAESGSGAGPALERLCRTYWFPLYAYVRREGYDPTEAKDLIQAFFERLLEKGYLQQADRNKGRFRSFLLGCLRHFLSDQRDRARAARRGGGQVVIAWDSLEAEERYRLEPKDQMSPDRVYERRWAAVLLESAQVRLREEYRSARKEALYEFLTNERHGEPGETTTYAAGAARLGVTEKAVRSEAYRLRRRYQELVREEVAQTVSSPAELEDEIRHLLAVVSG